jgi:exopolyphosphatase/guanosine-5'-triphosphate,3'-diphosphate pyrophosphatase
MNNLPREGSHQLAASQSAGPGGDPRDDGISGLDRPADITQPHDGKSGIRLVAVIDIGATSIRMSVAEISPDGQFRTLDTLVQAVDLGREAFDTRRISRATIERSVNILRRYQRVVREYGIRSTSQIRVVATSAVREATNRLAFTDRVYIATGLIVEVIDEAEVNRVTFMGVNPHLEQDAELRAARSVVVEVGGGSTDLLVMRDGHMLLSDTFRLGSLRLLQSLESLNSTTTRRRQLMEYQIARIIDRVSETVADEPNTRLIAIGGDIRFAARVILDHWDHDTLAEIPTNKLESLTNEVLRLNDDTLVKRYGVSYIEAGTIGPALLVYLLLARHFGVENVLVSDSNLRDGLVYEMAVRGSWTEAFRKQIIRSAISLGRKCDFDEEHAVHVADMASELFGQLKREHRLADRYEVLLHVAAILYQVGTFINTRSSHKHAMYIIRNSELFGLSRHDLLLVGLVARYHRRASPQPTHEGYATLDREGRVVVSKLAAILRVAIALDETHSGRVRQIRCVREAKRLIIETPGVDDVSIEQLGLRQNGMLFLEVFGIPVMLRAGA